MWLGITGVEIYYKLMITLDVVKHHRVEIYYKLMIHWMWLSITGLRYITN